MKISAILLAAGESKRMGSNKLLLDLGGQILVERVVDVLLRSLVDEVVVVAGFEWESVRWHLRRKGVRVIYNPQYREGMAASIREGLRHIDPDSHGVLIALADHPLLMPDTVDRLIHVYWHTRKGIVCPTHRGQRGHPVIFNLKKYGQGLSKLKGDIGGKAIIMAHRDDLLEYPVDSPGVITDIDVWQDYEECVRLIAEESGSIHKEGKRE
jgi:molybdenum cofactor cytidylyltransferase